MKAQDQPEETDERKRQDTGQQECMAAGLKSNDKWRVHYSREIV